MVKKVTSIATIALLLLVASASDYLRYRCHDGSVRMSCCCIDEEVAAETEAPPTRLVEGRCSQAELFHFVRSPSSNEQSAPSLLPPAVTAASGWLAVTADRDGGHYHSIRLRAPGLGPPLILLKRSFLI